MIEKSAAEEYTRDEPLVIWTDDDVKLEVFAESGGVASVEGDNLARIRNPEWIVRANGVERGGWGEATIDDAEGDVRAKALTWWAETRAGLTAKERQTNR